MAYFRLHLEATRERGGPFEKKIKVWRERERERERERKKERRTGKLE